MLGVLAATTVWAVAGAAVRARKEPGQRVPALLMAGTALGVLAAPWAGPDWELSALGWNFALGAALWRDLDPDWDWPWLLVAGLGGGYILYRGGIFALAGAALALTAAAAVGRLGAWSAGSGNGLRVKPYRRHLLVCVDGPCRHRGALTLRQALGRDRRFRLGAGMRVTPSGCLGCCRDGPVVWAEPEGKLYRRVEASFLEPLLGSESDTSGGPA